MSITTSDLPSGYYVDCDPDAPVLRRSDGCMVAAFSACGATPEEIRKTAEEDVRGTSPARMVLQVCFFGDFEVVRDGEALPLGRNTKAVAILKYLLAHRGRPVSRDHLMGWLWPESNLRKARWSLNSAISALRRLLLGRHKDSPRGCAGHIILEGERYRLGPSIEMSSDVDEFDARRERGRRLERDRRPAEAVSEYASAVALYRDDYLVGDLYEDWTMVERERLLNAYVETLCRLADIYEGAGEYREAIGTCFSLLEKDPHCEWAHRLLMACHARLGFPALAARQYELCDGLVRRTYGQGPSPETQVLQRRITAQQVR